MSGSVRLAARALRSGQRGAQLLTVGLAALTVSGCAMDSCEESIPALAEIRIEGNDYSQAWDIQATDDGGFIIGGRAGTELTTDAYLVKTDASGDVEWTRTFNRSGDQEGLSVQPAGDGGYILAGVTGGIVGDGRTVFGETDIFIAKADGMGNVVWTRAVEMDRFTAAYGVCVNADGTFAVTGATAEAQFGFYDAFIIKFDPEGQELWRQRFIMGEFGLADAIVTTRDGGYAIAAFASYDDGLYVVKTDGEGNKVWDFVGRNSGAPGVYGIGRGIVQTQDDGYAIVCDDYNEMVVVKLDSEGNLAWTTTVPGAPYAKGYDLVEAADGSIVAAGESFSRHPLFGFRICHRYHAVRLDGEGKVRWTGRLRGTEDTDGIAYALTTGADGNYVLAGFGGNGPGVYLLTTDAGLN